MWSPNVYWVHELHMCGGGFVHCLVRKIIRKMALLCVVVYTFFDLSLSKQEQKDLGEFKVSLFCITSFGQSEIHSETLSEKQFFKHWIEDFNSALQWPLSLLHRSLTSGKSIQGSKCSSHLRVKESLSQITRTNPETLCRCYLRKPSLNQWYGQAQNIWICFPRGMKNYFKDALKNSIIERFNSKFLVFIKNMYGNGN